MIRVTLPAQLQQLAHVGREVNLDVAGPVTPRAILDALEAHYPALRGTIRDSLTQQRREFLRFYTCGEDVSLSGLDTLLPQAVAEGREKFMIVGAIAGG